MTKEKFMGEKAGWAKVKIVQVVKAGRQQDIETAHSPQALSSGLRRVPVRG